MPAAASISVRSGAPAPFAPGANAAAVIVTMGCRRDDALMSPRGGADSRCVIALIPGRPAVTPDRLTVIPDALTAIADRSTVIPDRTTV